MSGSAVSGSAAGSPGRAAAPASDATSATSREQEVSRSAQRQPADSLKADALSLGQDNTVSRSESLSGQAPQVIAQALLSSYGWSASQFGCLDSLWTRESGWRTTAANPSGAYGIPQALPGSKMSSAGADWQSSAETQIKWGLGYIAERYGSPCGAWAHSEGHGWY